MLGHHGFPLVLLARVVLLALVVRSMQLGWIHIRGREHRSPTQRADARFVQHAIVAAGRSRLALAHRGLDHRSTRLGVGVKDQGHGVQELLALVGRNWNENRTIADDSGEQLCRHAELFSERRVRRVVRRAHRDVRVGDGAVKNSSTGPARSVVTAVP